VRASSIAERNADGESVVIGVLQDITAAKLASTKVEYMNRLYLVLGLTNEAIARESDISAILKIACRVAVERGGFASAWIALLDSTGQRLHAAAGAAAVNGLCREFDAPDEMCNSGITDRCRQSGDRAISSGSATASLTQRSTEAAVREHFSSSGAFPLKVDGRLAGVFTFGSNEPELFTSSQELALFEQLAIDISFALETEFRRVERRLVDEALLESERKFRQIAENIDQVFWLADTSLRMLYVSPAYEKIWGRRVEPLVSGEMSWLDGVHAEDRSGLQDALETALRTGRCDQNYRICRPDGGVRWIKDRAFVLSDGTGSPYRIVGTASDVTEQRDLENHLRQVQKMEAVGVLAGGIAHDFNNVLVAILSYAALLLQDLRPGDPMRDDVLEIETAAERAADLTRQLLAFSRQQVLQPRVIDVDEVVSGMTRMLKRLIGDDIQLVASLCGTPATVYVDPGQMEQVLMNLAVNARDAMPQGGTLRIEVSLCELDASSARRLAIEGGAYVRLDVTDSGIGMDEATQARIFEPFFTTKPLGKGTGLGLSTVFGIVSQSGGAIDVESASEMGSTFHIWLPSATKEVEVQHPQPAPPESAVANRSHACGTILLVEDDEHVRRLAFAVLTKSGYQVFPVSSGGDALILWERQLGQIDLLLTDVVMPLMGGEELVHRFQQLQPGLRFILMSGYSERAVNSSTFPLSGVFLEKPFTPDKLLKCVADALSLAH
jgi:two-component system, cell cycle sensor histidine kinase and response regulator CckA